MSEESTRLPVMWVDAEKYKRAINDQAFYESLMGAGVDNWEGWAQACADYDPPYPEFE